MDRYTEAAQAATESLSRDPGFARARVGLADAWLGMDESQSYMDKKLVLANGRRHGTTLRRPQEVFEQEERQTLKPLPALAYEIEEFHEGVVRQDGHVRFANKYYSVDEKYKEEKVVVLGDSNVVSIYHKGKLLEVHARITDPNQSKSTKPEHLKPWERAMQDDSMYRKGGDAGSAVVWRSDSWPAARGLLTRVRSGAF